MHNRTMPIISRRVDNSKGTTRILKENIHAQPGQKSMLSTAYQTSKPGVISHIRKNSAQELPKKPNANENKKVAKINLYGESPLKELDINTLSGSTRFHKQIGLGLEKTDLERQNSNCFKDYGIEIENYTKELELKFLTSDCLKNHDITPPLRAKMVDWMVEVLTNFKCNDRTYFLSIGIMDRYLKAKTIRKPISELHLIGVTSMFLASKYEDILPLRMDTMYEKIAHKKILPQSIRSCEQDMLAVLEWFLQAPTVYEFVVRYCKLLTATWEETRDLVSKMAIYLAKMCSHEYSFCNIRPSLFAIGCVYVGIKITEQLKKISILNKSVVEQMILICGYKEDEITGIAQKVLGIAQNFDTLFPNLTNLKKTQLVNCSQIS